MFSSKFKAHFSNFFKKPKTEKEIKNEKELAELTESVENLPKDFDEKILFEWIDSEIEKIRKKEGRFIKDCPYKKSYSRAFLGPNINDYIRMGFHDEIQYLLKFKILVCLNP